MLLKVFKHDFKACVRYEVPILFALLGAVVLGCVNIVLLAPEIFQTSETISEITSTIGYFGLIFVLIAMVAVALMMTFILYVRFYNSMATDEAYLTLTLPVKPSALIAGKLFSALLWSVISLAALALSVFVFLTTAVLVVAEDSINIFQIYGEFFVEVWDSIVRIFAENGWLAVLNIIEVVVGWVVGFLTIYFAILFASSFAKKHKILSAVSVVFGVNLVVSIVTSLIKNAVETSGVFLGEADIIDMLLGNYKEILMFECGVDIVINILLGALFFWLSTFLIKKKVNLD